MVRNNSIEMSGRTVDIAVDKALEKLKVRQNEVEVEILDEGEVGGLLGFGRRPALVRVSLKAAAAADNDPADCDDDEADSEEADILEFDETDRDEADASSERGFAAAENAVLDYFQDVLSGIGIHGRIDSYVDGEGSLHIDVSGSDSGAAIGRHGETLEALQYLANVVANKYVDDYLRVVVDVAGYRKRSEERIQDLANRTADKVMASGREIKLKPMNPAERRLVHMCLREYPGIVTYSEGRDPRRHIVVAPSDGVEVIDDKKA
ncbi:MAG: protein jag [Clostridiaceae bacterium]|nr:protein jag [Clostridiaceae bacterium]